MQSLLPVILVSLAAILWILGKWLPFSEPLHTVRAYGLPPGDERTSQVSIQVSSGSRRLWPRGGLTGPQVNQGRWLPAFGTRA